VSTSVRAIASTESEPDTPGRMIANSSPLRRVTVSPERTHVFMRSATAFSSASPTL
jgi:hypothetical protein